MYMYALGGEESDGDSPTTYDRLGRIDKKLNYCIYMYIHRTMYIEPTVYRINCRA